MAINQTQVDWQKTALRLPRDLHKQVHEAAAAEGRTFNGQLVIFIRECIKSRAHHDCMEGAKAQGAQA